MSSLVNNDPIHLAYYNRVIIPDITFMQKLNNYSFYEQLCNSILQEYFMFVFGQ